MINKKIFSVVNSRIQKYMRCPSCKCSSYVFGEYVSRFTFEKYLPIILRNNGARKWVIMPNSVRQENAISKRRDNSEMFVKNNHIQHATSMQQLIRILYLYLIVAFMAKNALIPEKTNSSIIIQIINNPPMFLYSLMRFCRKSIIAQKLLFVKKNSAPYGTENSYLVVFVKIRDSTESNHRWWCLYSEFFPWQYNEMGQIDTGNSKRRKWFPPLSAKNHRKQLTTVPSFSKKSLGLNFCFAVSKEKAKRLKSPRKYDIISIVDRYWR